MSASQSPVTAAGTTTGVDYDRWRRTIGLFLGPALALVLLITPTGLDPDAHRLAAISVLVIVYWVTEAIPFAVTALLGMALIVVFGVQTASDVLAALGNDIIVLFIGSFMLAMAMQVHGLDRRIAFSLLSTGWVGDSTVRTMLMLGFVSWLLSVLISNTATAAMLVPVGVTVARSMAQTMHGEDTPEHAKARRDFITGLLLMVAFGASIGGLATPIGTPSNLIGISLAEEEYQTNIQFLEWMAFGVPLAIVLLAIAVGVVLAFYRPEVRTIPGQRAAMRQRLGDLGSLTAGERNSIIAIGLAVFLWLFPDLLTLFLGASNEFAQKVNDQLPEGISALLAASLLFFLPVNWPKREFTLRWDEAVRIDWGTVLLFAGGIALGQAVIATGLAKAIGDEILDVVGTGSGVLEGVGVSASVIVTEMTSNVASVNIVAPVMTAAAGTGETGLVVTVGVTLAAALGFMLPVSTPPNAIAYGTGEIRIVDMIKTGFLVSICGGVIIWLASLWFLPLVVRI